MLLFVMYFSIKPEHCKIEMASDGEIIIYPVDPGASVKVNGDTLTGQSAFSTWGLSSQYISYRKIFFNQTN